MAENSAISWTDDTFNPWVGCMKVSPACDGCYAEALMGMTGRYKRVEWGSPEAGVGTRVRTVPSTWAKPLKWEREAAAAVAAWRTNPFARPETPKPSRFVFCASLADVFDNQVPPEWRRDLFDLIRMTPHLTWLLLTKRPQNILKLFLDSTDSLCGPAKPEQRAEFLWPRNAAIGCTVVTQQEADRDIPHLLKAAAALRPAFAFLSMEPLFEIVDIRWAISRNPLDLAAGFLVRGHFSPGLKTLVRVTWAITGGETDQGAHKARAANVAWERSIRDQCAAAGVAYHRKQAGEWLCFAHEDPAVSTDPVTGSLVVHFQGRRYAESDVVAWNFPYPVVAAKVGKKAAGRLLDGAEHNARPEVAHG